MSLSFGTLLAVLGTTVGGAGPQQVLEIVFENGRDVFHDGMRALETPVAIDHRAHTLYARDAEEPFGAMVFSLATGDRIRTYRVGEGEGPGELTQLRSFALVSEGGV